MTTTVVDEGLLAAARSAMASLRRAENAVRGSVVALDAAGVAVPAGYHSTPRLIEAALRVDPAEAKRSLAHGESLSARVSGEALEPALPASARAARDGAIGSAHLRVINRAMEHLERVPGLDPTVLDALSAPAGPDDTRSLGRRRGRTPRPGGPEPFP